MSAPSQPSAKDANGQQGQSQTETNARLLELIQKVGETMGGPQGDPEAQKGKELLSREMQEFRQAHRRLLQNQRVLEEAIARAPALAHIKGEIEKDEKDLRGIDARIRRILAEPRMQEVATMLESIRRIVGDIPPP